MVNVEERKEGKWETAYQDKSPFIDKEGTVWFKIEWFKTHLDTQKEWQMPSNQTTSFIKGVFKKNGNQFGHFLPRWPHLQSATPYMAFPPCTIFHNPDLK